METDHDIEFKHINSDAIYLGQCTALSGSKVSFLTEHSVKENTGLEIKVHTNNPANPYLTAYAECYKNSRTTTEKFEIFATIKIIKGN